MHINWFRGRYKEGIRADVSLLEKNEKSDEFQEGFETGRTTRRGVMRHIGQLIAWCYDHGVNPLKILQKVYPRYRWDAVRINADKPNSRKIIPVLRENDFIWHYQSVLITAKNMRRKKPYSICWIGEIVEYCDSAMLIMEHCTTIFDVKLCVRKKDLGEILPLKN